ncbi:MAG: tetratricopeptide repeat protein [Candidatus Pacebacteria bacterium]|nr:tetratricopeptide repeat protein [Candidatus Paceibacterota bacterium]
MRIGHRCVCLCLLTVSTSCINTGTGAQNNESRVPADLTLNEHEIDKSEALGYAARGFFLRLQKDRDPDEAQEYFLKALRSYPESKTILQYLAAPWTLRQNYQAIIQNLMPIAEENPDIVHLQLFLSATLQAAERTKDAIAMLEKTYYAAKVHDPDILRELIALYWATDQTHKAEHMLNKARRDPRLDDSFITYYGLALYHQTLAERIAQQDDTDKRKVRRHRQRAVHYAKRAVTYAEQVSRRQDVNNMLEIFSSNEAWEEGLDFLRKVRSNMPELRPALTLRMADYFYELGQKERAVKLLDELDMHTIGSPAFLIQLGRSLIRVGKIRDAASALDRALALAPENPGIRVSLGVIWLQLGFPARAVDMLEPVEDLSPAGLKILSRAYYGVDNIEKALEILKESEDKARSQEVDHFFTVQHYVYAAILYDEAGQYARARESAEKAVAFDAVNPAATNLLGYLLADHDEQLDEAEQLICIAVAQEPENAAYLDSLAWVYYRQHRYDKALNRINHTLRLSGDSPDPVILNHAGDIYSANGYPIMAVRYWWAAIEAGASDTETVRKKIEALNVDVILPQSPDTAAPQ